LDSPKIRVCEKFVTFRDFCQANILRFKETLHSFSWNSVINSNDVQDAFNCFSNSLISLHDVYFPLKTVKFNRNFNPIDKWMSKGLLISRRQKYALSKKCIVEPSQINTSNFKAYRNVYNKAIRCAKKHYFEKQLQINKSNLKNTWKILK
jgi:hypothetical protein